MRKRTEIHRKI